MPGAAYGAIWREKVAVALSPAGSVAATVNEYVPAAVGVPSSAPSSAPPGDRVRPGGRAPAATVKVYGPGGPDAVRVWA